MLLCPEGLLGRFGTTLGSILEPSWGHLELIVGVFSLAFDSVDEDAIYKILVDDGKADLFNIIAHGVSLISQQMAITEVGPPLNNYVKKIT